MAAVDDLVAAAAGLTLRTRCISRGCALCCQPRFVFFDDDPSEEELSASAKRKFYVVKKGRCGSEAIYSHWDLAKVHVLGISGALHESCGTADEGRQIWADFCHTNHQHASTSRRANTARRPGHAPPPYSPMTPPSSPRPAPVTPTSPTSRPTPSATPERFYRVSGSPRVLLHASDAEAELRRSPGATLLVETSLEDIEDGDEVVPVDTVHFYRVFGSFRVQSSRDAALTELVNSQAAGLLVGDSLDGVMG
ncbi:hypothetical protein C8R47DRAFT_1218542 [Mycena vitilis]|nr:hypothetical protein C8R47DRAFT_1218542 [Mycena vitilis]